MRPRIHVAANNGDVAGGEVMLLRLCVALRDLGHEPVVVGPRLPGELLDLARGEGLAVVPLEGGDRRGYLRALRRWSRATPGPLWCNGLVPSFATAGRRERVVHLHQLPRSAAQRRALGIARAGARRVLAPSAFMGGQLRGTEVLANWTEDVPLLAPRERSGAAQPVRVGFLGRYSTAKGLDVLARSLALLPAPVRGGIELVIAGDGRQVPPDEVAAVLRAVAQAPVPHRDLGWVPRDDFFRSVDLAVFPSVWAEPFGLVVAEAMARGVPFVVSDRGALEEVAGPGHPWVARGGDPEDLARVLTRALTAPAAARAAAVERARERWQERYSAAAGRSALARLVRDLGWE